MSPNRKVHPKGGFLELILAQWCLETLHCMAGYRCKQSVQVSRYRFLVCLRSLCLRQPQLKIDSCSCSCRSRIDQSRLEFQLLKLEYLRTSLVVLRLSLPVMKNNKKFFNSLNLAGSLLRSLWITGCSYLPCLYSDSS